MSPGKHAVRRSSLKTNSHNAIGPAAPTPLLVDVWALYGVVREMPTLPSFKMDGLQPARTIIDLHGYSAHEHGRNDHTSAIVTPSPAALPTSHSHGVMERDSVAPIADDFQPHKGHETEQQGLHQQSTTGSLSPTHQQSSLSILFSRTIVRGTGRRLPMLDKELASGKTT